MLRKLIILFSLFLIPHQSYAAIAASMNWYVRAGGNAANGGGYDGTTYPGGTNYADQDAAELSLTDMATTGVTTTVTSATAGFTAAMVGNVLRVSAGTNWTAGYYVIASYVNSTTITLDSAPTTGAGVSGVGSIGGAFASYIELSNGGDCTAPTLTTPLIAGNTINVRGAGTDNPSSADYTQACYATYPNGNNSVGLIDWVGYNGRPYILLNGLSFYTINDHVFSNIKLGTNSTSFAIDGIIYGVGYVGIYNVYFDEEGNDINAVQSTGQLSVINSKFINTGSFTDGSYLAIECGSFNNLLSGNTIDTWDGGGINCNTMGSIINNLIINTGGQGISINSGEVGYSTNIYGNTIYNNAGNGIIINTVNDLFSSSVRNNILVKNGGYGLNLNSGSTSLNNSLTNFRNDYNDYGTGATANTLGTINNGSLGAHDLQLDPQFTNASGGNFAIGTNLQAMGFPGTYPEGNTTSYLDIGAAQHQGSSGGSSNKGYIY